ncbi:hypothetical protein HJFPF1_04893 [Paramyrothecium foliicola]|nr:hypothetical protein HJFPF1_04893 [Paramyrothecium foliicola]
MDGNSPAALGGHDAKEAVARDLLDDLVLQDGRDDDFGGDQRHGRGGESDEEGGLHDGFASASVRARANDSGGGGL